MFMRQIPPEKVQAGIITDFVVPMLQGTGIAFCVIVSSLTSLAALDSWGWAKGEQLIVGLFGVLVIIGVLAAVRSVPESNEPLRSLGFAISIMLPVFLGLAAVVYNLPRLLDGGFVLQLYRVFVIIAGYFFVIAIVLAVILKTQSIQAAAFILPIVALPIGAAWFFLASWVRAYWFPVVASTVALGLDAGMGLLGFNLARELWDRWLPKTPGERMAGDYFDRRWPRQSQPMAAGPVLYRADRDQRTPQQRLKDRLELFIAYAWHKPTVRFLKSVGFTSNSDPTAPGEIERFRDLLIASGAAEWKDPRAYEDESYRHKGWHLIEPPKEAMERAFL